VGFLREFSRERLPAQFGFNCDRCVPRVQRLAISDFLQFLSPWEAKGSVKSALGGPAPRRSILVDNVVTWLVGNAAPRDGIATQFGEESL
jgi:hypothetical protein